MTNYRVRIKRKVLIKYWLMFSACVLLISSVIYWLLQFEHKSDVFYEVERNTLVFKGNYTYGKARARFGEFELPSGKLVRARSISDLLLFEGRLYCVVTLAHARKKPQYLVYAKEYCEAKFRK
ncbi:hypothetical protein [Catenovulum agarivorans]|uniref:hypothetical protein n=1 Tax=Catenovulum agarivorans TaxID=1172192 RepID=UPI000372064B|nr:hypothetical protein [Catenovulum agarivorans]